MSQIPSSALVKAVSSLSVEPGSHHRLSARISKEWTTQQYVAAYVVPAKLHNPLLTRQFCLGWAFDGLDVVRNSEVH